MNTQETRKNHFLRTVGGVIIFIAAIAYVGELDFIDETESQKEYCKNVKSGAWGAYKNIKCGE